MRGVAVVVGQSTEEDVRFSPSSLLEQKEEVLLEPLEVGGEMMYHGLRNDKDFEGTTTWDSASLRTPLLFRERERERA